MSTERSASELEESLLIRKDVNTLDVEKTHTAPDKSESNDIVCFKIGLNDAICCSLSWRAVDEISAFIYSITNPLTVAKPFKETIPVVINKTAGLVLSLLGKDDPALEDSPYVQGVAWGIAAFCYLALSYDNWKTYKKIITNVYGPSEDEDGKPTSAFKKCWERFTDSFFGSKIMSLLSFTSKGSIASLSFADAISQLIKLDSSVLSKLLVSLTLPFNARFQYVNFASGKDDKKQKATLLNSSKHPEQKVVHSQISSEEKSRWSTLSQGWEKVRKPLDHASAMIYSGTNPATYLVSCLTLPELLAESEPPPWLQYFTAFLVILFYIALGYETLKSSNRRVKDYYEKFETPDHKEASPVPDNKKTLAESTKCLTHVSSTSRWTASVVKGVTSTTPLVESLFSYNNSLAYSLGVLAVPNIRSQVVNFRKNKQPHGDTDSRDDKSRGKLEFFPTPPQDLSRNSEPTQGFSIAPWEGELTRFGFGEESEDGPEIIVMDDEETEETEENPTP